MAKRPQLHRLDLLTINHVLAGCDMRGNPGHHKPISFTRNELARFTAATNIDVILGAVDDRLAPTAHTHLYAKLLTHLTRMNAQTDLGINVYFMRYGADIVEAVRAKPELVSKTISITGILRAWEQNLHDIELITQKLPHEAPPRPILWSNGMFTLTELTHPLHLVHEAQVLCHCLAKPRGPITTFNPSDPANWPKLPYWAKLARREARLFSLMRNGHPEITLYATRRTVDMMRTHDNAMVDTVIPNQFTALCQALNHLRHTIGIRLFHELPEPPSPPLSAYPHSYVLMPDGTFVEPTLERIPLALAGTLIVTPKTPAAIVEAIRTNPTQLRIVHMTRPPRRRHPYVEAAPRSAGTPRERRQPNPQLSVTIVTAPPPRTNAPSIPITIVDDDQPILHTLRLALTAEGYEVDTYQDPLVALPKVILVPPPLLILNGHMRPMHGIDFFQHYRRYSRRPVWFFSASAAEIGEQLEALGTPAEAYIPKPVPLRILILLVNRLLRPDSTPKNSLTNLANTRLLH